MSQHVTLQFVSIDVYVVLAQLASSVGLTLVHEHSGGSPPRVSVEADNEPAGPVLERVLRKTSLESMVAGRALLVGSPAWLRPYRNTTTFTVTYATLGVSKAIEIVQGVFPYVQGTVKGATVTYQVPKAELDRIKDIATSLDKPK